MGYLEVELADGVALAEDLGRIVEEVHDLILGVLDVHPNVVNHFGILGQILPDESGQGNHEGAPGGIAPHSSVHQIVYSDISRVVPYCHWQKHSYFTIDIMVSYVWICTDEQGSITEGLYIFLLKPGKELTGFRAFSASASCPTPKVRIMESAED